MNDACRMWGKLGTSDTIMYPLASSTRYPFSVAANSKAFKDILWPWCRGPIFFFVFVRIMLVSSFRCHFPGMHYMPWTKRLQGNRLGWPDLLLFRCCKDCADELVVAGATAQVAGQEVAGVVLGRMGVLIQKCLGGDDEAGSAYAALQGRAFEETLLQGVQALRSGDALDGCDVPALDFGGHDQTRVDKAAVEDDVASPAVAVVATLLGACQAQLIAQDC